MGGFRFLTLAAARGTGAGPPALGSWRPCRATPPPREYVGRWSSPPCSLLSSAAAVPGRWSSGRGGRHPDHPHTLARGRRLRRRGRQPPAAAAPRLPLDLRRHRRVRQPPAPGGGRRAAAQRGRRLDDGRGQSGAGRHHAGLLRPGPRRQRVVVRPPDNPGDQLAGGNRGAEAGIAMLATPRVGDGYRRGYAPGVVDDVVQVDSITGSETVPAGTYDDLVAIGERSELDSGRSTDRSYAAGVGLVLETGVGVDYRSLRLLSADLPLRSR